MNNQLDFDDIFDYRQPAWWENPWTWFAIISCITVGAVVFYYAVRWYKSRKAVLSPQERALKRLKKISIDSLATQEAYKQLYVELLSTVKTYCFEQHGYKITGKTGAEVLGYMKTYANSSVFYPVVKQLVEHGLTIKFAQQDAQKERAKEDYLFALEAISGDNQVKQKQ